MFDGDDLGDLALIFFPTSLVGLFFWLIMICIGLFVVSINKDECAQLACKNGQHAQLLDNRCLCVETPISK